MFRNFLIILALLMSVSLFARVTNSSGFDAKDKASACTNAKNGCDEYVDIDDNEELSSMSSCSCSKDSNGFWTCNVTCTIKKSK